MDNQDFLDMPQSGIVITSEAVDAASRLQIWIKTTAIINICFFSIILISSWKDESTRLVYIAFLLASIFALYGAINLNKFYHEEDSIFLEKYSSYTYWHYLTLAIIFIIVTLFVLVSEIF